MSEPVLRARELTRRFGGLVAVDRVSLELHRGSVRALNRPEGGLEVVLKFPLDRLPAAA